MGATVAAGLLVGSAPSSADAKPTAAPAAPTASYPVVVGEPPRTSAATPVTWPAPRAQRATAHEVVRVDIPTVLIGTSDGLPDLLRQRVTYRATFRVLVTGPVAVHSLGIWSPGTRVDRCTDVRPVVGQVSTITCDVQVMRRSQQPLVVRAWLHTQSGLVSRDWTHSVGS